MFKAEIEISGYRGNRCLDCRFKIDSLCLLCHIPRGKPPWLGKLSCLTNRIEECF